MNSTESAKRRFKREFLWVIRFERSSEMTGSKNCCRVMRNKHGMLFVICVPTNFIGNARAENYDELVDEMTMQYQKLGSNVSKDQLPSFSSEFLH